MAVPGRAAVGRIDGLTEVGAGNPEAVIRPIIDAHVNAARHVTFDAEMAVTGFALKFTLVKVVLVTVVLVGPVALEAEIVALLVQGQAVHIMAVAAAHFMAVHL